jgi:hypothetical protein
MRHSYTVEEGFIYSSSSTATIEIMADSKGKIGQTVRDINSFRWLFPLLGKIGWPIVGSLMRNSRARLEKERKPNPYRLKRGPRGKGIY